MDEVTPRLTGDTKISAAADILSLVATDMLPVARSGSTTAYHATYAEIGMQGTAVPAVDGVGAAGTSMLWSPQDHVHPTDTTRAPLNSPAFTGTPTAPTPGINTNTTQLATTAFVLNQASGILPLMDGPAAAGTATAWSRGDHVHATDTSRAPLASPTFTGTVTLPTAVGVTPLTADNSTNVATTAFVKSQSYLTGNQTVTLSGDVTGSGATAITTTLPTVNSNVGTFQGLTVNGKGLVTAASNQSYAPLASPAFSGTPSLPTGTTGVTQTAGTSNTTLATTAFVATSFAPLAAPVFTGDARAVTAATGDNDTSIATTAFVQTAVAPALNDQGRNFVHNSRFNVQQRGTGSWTTTGSYTADRWKMFVSTSTLTMSIVAANDTMRSQIGDESAINVLQGAVTGTAGAGDYAIAQQLLEGVRRLAGKTVTVSFYAAAASGAPKLGVSIDQNFGTGGSPSAAVNGTGQTVTLSSATYARYSLTFAIASASGKTLGTNGDDSTALTLWYSAGSSFNTRSGTVGVQTATIFLWGVQLEIGSVATPLETIDPVRELQQCQRFYQVYRQLQINAYGGAGAPIGNSFLFPVTMRAAPTINFANTSYGNASGINAIDATPGAVYVYVICGGTTGGLTYTSDLTASADL